MIILIFIQVNVCNLYLPFEVNYLKSWPVLKHKEVGIDFNGQFISFLVINVNFTD